VARQIVRRATAFLWGRPPGLWPTPSSAST